MGSAKIRNMEEFAELSGVSRPTLSKYFNDPASVRATTRSRIEAALERFDYRPNMYAINQNRRLTKNIGIVVPYLADPFFAEIARTIETRCIDAGFSPYLFSSHGRQDLENGILDTLRSMKPAGVLLAPLGRSSDRKVVERFCRDVPTVLFDSNIEGVGDVFVGSDNPQFTSLMVEYLCRTGEPPAFFEMKTPPNPNARKRRSGYLAAMEKQGHAPTILEAEGEGWALEEIGRREGIRLLETRRFKTGSILCSNDRLAIGLLSACYHLNLRVGITEGCDLRVAGLDGHPFSSFTSPPLTTVSHDYEAISERSVETLFHMIENGGSVSKRTEKLFEGKLLMRASA
ncbi:LacI family DNA-binding transcriptional regulator [Salaquimonas pukyongi]|uniref:LacI family DNA-binding transcriptional regulator n=1 Tax=Salaquimonas pukyongi TaxID=2712698 RepID=UPI0019683F04|nr:LacI family DNA-binding transcriptional regulator [Salaquimonas pukyongi]